MIIQNVKNLVWIKGSITPKSYLLKKKVIAVYLKAMKGICYDNLLKLSETLTVEH